MKNTTKRVLTGILAVLMAAGCGISAFAHSGRTDGSGGHKDKKNVSGLGYYHYHCGGYPAHLHTGGVCPYENNSYYDDTSSWTDTSDTSAWFDTSDTSAWTSTTETTVKTTVPQDDGVIGSVVTTDIVAYINGYEIPSYNVDGNIVVIGADLRSYGFDVVYDNIARTSSVSLSENGGTWDPIIITTDDSMDIGAEVMRVYETDITVLINGIPVTGYNVEGRMAFRFAELAEFGTYYYDNESRSTNLWIW